MSSQARPRARAPEETSATIRKGRCTNPRQSDASRTRRKKAGALATSTSSCVPFHLPSSPQRSSHTRTRLYLHAVIDNFSRRILAWRLLDRFDPASSVAVLVEAGKAVVGAAAAPTLLADAGVENRNAAVDALIESGLLKRVLAQTEIHFSNSMIEAWWRSLKHGWLFLHPPDSMTKVCRLVEFYVAEHNSRLPHSAFRGQTPDEMYFGTGDAVPDRLAAARMDARAARLAANRARECPVCA